MLDKLGLSEISSSVMVASVFDKLPWESIEHALATTATAVVAYLVRLGVAYVRKKCGK
jgi:uncharacterized membrane protein